MKPRQTEPTEVGEAGDFARRLARAMGTVLQPDDGTPAAADLLTYGEALASARTTTLASLDQAFPDSATDMLGAHERMRGVPTNTRLTDSQRQTTVTAAARANFSGTPQDILTAVQTYDPTAYLIETLAADVTANPVSVYNYGIVLAPAVFNDLRIRAEIYAIMRKMEMAGARGSLTTGVGFYFDGYNGSRFDDTLFNP